MGVEVEVGGGSWQQLQNMFCFIFTSVWLFGCDGVKWLTDWYGKQQQNVLQYMFNSPVNIVLYKNLWMTSTLVYLDNPFENLKHIFVESGWLISVPNCGSMFSNIYWTQLIARQMSCVHFLHVSFITTNLFTSFQTSWHLMWMSLDRRWKGKDVCILLT